MLSAASGCCCTGRGSRCWAGRCVAWLLDFDCTLLVLCCDNASYKPIDRLLLCVYPADLGGSATATACRDVLWLHVCVCVVRIMQHLLGSLPSSPTYLLSCT
jgi:hypothetical protein